jgi:hypothetical protein
MMMMRVEATGLGPGCYLSWLHQLHNALLLHMANAVQLLYRAAAAASSLQCNAVYVHALSQCEAPACCLNSMQSAMSCEVCFLSVI